MSHIEDILNSIKDSADNLYAVLGSNAEPSAALALDISNNAGKLLSEISDLTNEWKQAQAKICDLENELETVREELAKRPIAGRKRVYNDEKRAEIFAYYNENSYKDTVSHFGISPDTLNRIIKENQ